MSSQYSALVSGSGPPNFRSIRLGPNPNPNPNSRRRPNPNPNPSPMRRPNPNPRRMPNPNPNPTGSWVGPNSTQVPNIRRRPMHVNLLLENRVVIRGQSVDSNKWDSRFDYSPALSQHSHVMALPIEPVMLAHPIEPAVVTHLIEPAIGRDDLILLVLKWRRWERHGSVSTTIRVPIQISRKVTWNNYY